MIYLFSFKFLGGFILVVAFFPLSLIWLAGRGDRIQKCNRCHKPIFKTNRIYCEFEQSEGFFYKLLPVKVFKLKTADEIRCYSPTCFEHQELFQTPYSNKAVLLNRTVIRNKYFNDRFIVTNPGILD